MLRDNLVGLFAPKQNSGTQALGDEFSYLENPRPVGADSSLTESASSPFQTEPRHNTCGVVLRPFVILLLLDRKSFLPTREEPR